MFIRLARLNSFYSRETSLLAKTPHLHNYTNNIIDSSPNCNPIENVWRIMKDRIGRRVPRCTTNASLRAAIQEEWDAIESDEIASKVDSMPERIEAVHAVNGGHTRF